MNKFEYYTNDIVLESAGYDRLLELTKEIPNTIQEKISLFTQYIKEVEIKKAGTVIGECRTILKNYKNEVLSIPTTKFDNFKSNIKGFKVGAIIGALISALAAVGAVDGSEIDSSYYKAITISSIGFISIGALIGHSTNKQQQLKIDRRSLKDEATSNFTKNDVLKTINTLLAIVDKLPGTLVDFELAYMDAKNKYPKKNKEELVNIAKEEITHNAN